MNLEQLKAHVANGLISRQSHPSLPLAIYNYSPRCQYDRLWDDVTLQCRGLVLVDDQVVARPFRKFFNDTEHAEGEIPWHLPSEITEKLDGSLLIAFWFDGWQFATRGSFVSEQSKAGKRIFTEKYGHVALDPSVTYLFEVIYPGNRIVVDYRGLEDVILLGMIETATGRELPLVTAPAGLRVVRRLGADSDVKELRAIIRDDEEGYVVRFENGFRVKMKGQRYTELHRLITGVSSRSIWEALSADKSLDEMLAIIPDEFGNWVRAERGRQLLQFDQLCMRAQVAHDSVKGLPDRKSQALAILSTFKDVSAAAFALLDGKPIAPVLWKQLYPEYRRPEVSARIDT